MTLVRALHPPTTGGRALSRLRFRHDSSPCLVQLNSTPVHSTPLSTKPSSAQPNSTSLGSILAHRVSEENPFARQASSPPSQIRPADRRPLACWRPLLVAMICNKRPKPLSLDESTFTLEARECAGATRGSAPAGAAHSPGQPERKPMHCNLCTQIKADSLCRSSTQLRARYRATLPAVEKVTEIETETETATATPTGDRLSATPRAALCSGGTAERPIRPAAEGRTRRPRKRLIPN